MFVHTARGKACYNKDTKGKEVEIMKKISYEDYNWIGNKSVSHWIARMCKYELRKDGGGNYLIDIYVGLPIYILLCIPVHVAEFFRCA